MEIIAVQIDTAWEDPQANYAKVLALLEAACPSPGSLVVLPEAFASGFSMNVTTIAEPPGGPTETFLASTARRWGAAVLGGLVAKGTDGRGRNEAVVFGPDGSSLGRYRKLHPFSFAHEDRHYEPGRDGVTFAWGPFTVAPLICYDLRFPEVFRRVVRKGADLLVVIANWPQARHAHWGALLAARAIENQAYVLGVNRCGRDPSNTYAGGSVLYDPQGVAVALAGPDECILRAQADHDQVLEYRAAFPALRDMREDLL